MRNVITHELLEYSLVYYDECWFMGPRGHFYSGMCLVIRDVQIFHGLTGCQRDTSGLGRHSLVSEPRFINT